MYQQVHRSPSDAQGVSRKVAIAVFLSVLATIAGIVCYCSSQDAIIRGRMHDTMAMNGKRVHSTSGIGKIISSRSDVVGEVASNKAKKAGSIRKRDKEKALNKKMELHIEKIPDGIIDSKPPTFSPTAVPTKALMPLPHGCFQSPTEYTDEPQNKPKICQFRYEKDEPLIIPSGCIFFSQKDIGWDQFESSQAMMVCLQKSHGKVSLNGDDFKKRGLIKDDHSVVSIVKPGYGAKAKFYKGKEFNGPNVEFNKDRYHPLVHYKFPHNGHDEGILTNDHIQSVTFESTVETLPNSCDIALHQLMYCPFTYIKGESKTTPYGCALFTKDDIAYGGFEEGPAMYVCATKQASPVRISSNEFIENNFVQDGESVISIIKPGAGTAVQFFTEGDFDGNDGTFSKMKADIARHKFWPHSLTHYKFGGRYGRPGHDEVANDHVKSAILTSDAKRIPTSCKDLFSHRE